MEQSATLTRELTLDEAVAFAIFLQKNQHFAEAHELYRRVLEVSPDHPRALHYAGVMAHQQGKVREAIELIERSLTLVPDEADWHSNLGIVLQSDTKLDLAIAAYRRAIAVDPGHANAHSNLGVLLRATGQPVEAEAAYRAAINLNPEHIDAYANLGILLDGLKRTKEAVACYCKVITLRPKHREARKQLAVAHCALGDVAEAVRIFEEWLQEEPEDPIAQHMLAACTGRGVPERASNLFVETTFDSFASSFESKLEKLSYRAPALVAAMLENSGLEPLNGVDVLDAGCGTGLCGTLVAPFGRRLVGVDLSEKMLAQARDKKVYHELVKGELTEYLRAASDAFDLIVSADALVYFGDLKGVVEAAEAALRPNGLFVFTLEHAVGDVAGIGYRLELHGRYSHSRAYVEQLLMSSDLQPTIVQAELRMEAGAPVPGLVIRATKPRPFVHAG
ncbi:Predicted methyltransferase, contains TPR repeat [Rhodospirillales bacterium URHD0017]|nr:Predicted methyltransferase, contains TPR repeat [Rhodospirillales bacterium URHD0017]